MTVGKGVNSEVGHLATDLEGAKAWDALAVKIKGQATRS